MEEEKQIAMEDIDSQNGDTIPLMEVSTLFEQSILLLAQAFNATSYFRRKSILDTLFNVKSKVKEILKEQSDLLNDFSNQCLFGSCSENEFYKSVSAKQRSKSLFIELRRSSASSKNFNMSIPRANQSSLFRGAPCHIVQEVGGSICLQQHFNLWVSSNFLAILFPVILLNQEDIPSVHTVITFFSEERRFRMYLWLEDRRWIFIKRLKVA